MSENKEVFRIQKTGGEENKVRKKLSLWERKKRK